MKIEAIPRGVPLGVLVAALLGVFALFGIPAKYAPGARALLAVAPWVAIAASAWHLARTGRAASPAARARVGAAFLLIVPFALFSLLPGFGPPWYSTDAQNVQRFLVLAVGTVLVGAGLMALVRSITTSSGGLASSLTADAVRVATILYLVFTVCQTSAYRSAARGKLPADTFIGLDLFSVMLLMVATPFVYLATAAVASALAREGVLGRATSRGMIGLCLAAVACIAIKLGTAAMLDTEPLWTSAHWFTIPGFVLSIPAIPWMVPAALAVAILWRPDGLAVRPGQAVVREDSGQPLTARRDSVVAG